MKKLGFILVLVAFFLGACAAPIAMTSDSGSSSRAVGTTPVQAFGALKVTGNHVTSASGGAAQVKGMSMFWSQWSGDFYNASLVNNLVDQYGISLIRAAMGVESGGYLTNPAIEKAHVTSLVNAAIAKGIYVLIDWHDHNAITNQAASVSFFTEMANTYKNVPNVIFELFNEPDNESWPQVKAYAETVLAAIRGTGANNLVIVGTPTWSQDVDVAAADPITKYSNVAYTLHFYAATHKQSLRDKATLAMSRGIALFATEWGTCPASGDGTLDLAESQTWLNFLDANSISWANWSMFNKSEAASALVPSASATGPWNAGDLTQSGAWVFARFGTTIPTNTPTATPTTTPTTTPPPNESPYSGTRISLPGTIEVENFDNGGEGIAYHDSDSTNSGSAYRTAGVDIETCTEGGYNVGWTANGEYLKYMVSAAGGSYTLSARVASTTGNRNIHIEVDNINVTGAMAVPNTGAWQTYATITSPAFQLAAGNHIVKLYFEGDSVNINWIKASSGATPTPTVTPTPTPTITPTPTATSTPIGNVKVIYSKSDWGNGFTGTIKLTNSTAQTINNWKLNFSFAGNQVINQFWSAVVAQSGKNVTVSGLSYNSSLAPNASVEFGFNATYSGTNIDPTVFTVSY